MYHENFPETVSTSCRRSRVAVKITCLVSGDELKEDWVVPTCVYVFREKKTLITLFTKLKAYFESNQFYRRLTRFTDYSMQ